jgi:hypothetical protein
MGALWRYAVIRAVLLILLSLIVGSDALARGSVAAGSRTRNTGFRVAGGKIIDPNGKPFIVKGINFPGAGDATSVTQIQTLWPGVNFVRLAERNYTNVAGLTTFVTGLTNAGIVVEIEDHQVGPVLTGTALTTELNWYTSIASNWKDNPLVWFGSMNEPQTASTAISTQQLAIYNAIRGTGNKNPILMEFGAFGDSNGSSGSAVLSPATYKPMRNILWDAHYYGDQSGYSTTQTTVNNTLFGNATDTGVDSVLVIPSADGTVPVVEAEWGASASATLPIDPNVPQVVVAVTQWAVQQGYTQGHSAWYFGTDPTDGNTMTTNGTTLTSWGAMVAAALLATYDHVVLVIEENHTESEIVGCACAPFINNTLIAGGALMTNYTAITHPSEPNYFALYAGDTFGVTDDLNHTEADPTLATILQAAARSFTGYIETASPRKHNPWESFPEGTSVEKDFSLFPSDFTTLPTVAFVIPDLNDDMHDGTIQQGDTWLQNNISAYATWAKTHNSLLITTWDEDDSSGTNKVATIFNGARVIQGSFATAANHYNLLSTIAKAAGVKGPRNAGTAAPITAIFGP